MLQTVNPGFNEDMLLACLLEFRRGLAFPIRLAETALLRKDRMRQQGLDRFQILLRREATIKTECMDRRIAFQDFPYHLLGDGHIHLRPHDLPP